MRFVSVWSWVRSPQGACNVPPTRSARARQRLCTCVARRRTLSAQSTRGVASPQATRESASSVGSSPTKVSESLNAKQEGRTQTHSTRRASRAHSTQDANSAKACETRGRKVNVNLPLRVAATPAWMARGAFPSQATRKQLAVDHGLVAPPTFL